MIDWTQKKVAVVCGGPGSEREISLKTGAAFSDALRRCGIEPVVVDLLPENVQQLVGDPPDVVLNALHGMFGEDGALQGMLEILGVPYTGSGVQASAFAIDKVRSKCVFERFGVRTPAWSVVPEAPAPPMPMPIPFVVKPSLEGSSVGISIVKAESEWSAAYELAVEKRGAVLIEEFIDGRELSVGVFDDEIMGIIEIAPADGWYDYEAKYQRNDTTYAAPTDLSADVLAEIRAQARRGYDALGCRGVARVDVMLRGSDLVPFVLEVNTVPGMTVTSLVPKLAADNGVPFDEFVLSLLDSATTDGPA
ncbi:MAG: D-alanine-D-alanine ligase [Bradymonadia bacterium]|jgi:D-alanine-D-alanine ligase